ncbi:MAG: Maf family protein [Gammaproteobacteria bacterium]
MATPELVLASSSPYRQKLLEQLELPFRCESPAIDETPLTGELPTALVQRLAVAKAAAVGQQCTTASLVIGSDQVAVVNNVIFGKPGTTERAISQLQQMRGHCLEFMTGLCLLNTETGREHVRLVVFEVRFRDYSDAEIRRYVEREQPLNCAGSFRSEALGITLVESMSGSDPSALIGLPLIELGHLLRAEGITLP